MKHDPQQPQTLYRYESEAGFQIETTSEVVPIFVPHTNEVVWWNFDESSTERFFPSSPLDCGQLHTIDVATDGDWNRSGPGNHHTFHFFEGVCEVVLDPDLWRNLGADFPTAQCFATGPDCPWESLDNWSGRILGGTLVSDSICSVRRCFNESKRRIVGHTGTLAGPPYLVPQSRQEAIDLLVREDLIFFEDISLARNHSQSTARSVVARRLEEFDWGMSSWFWIKSSIAYSRSSPSERSPR